MAVIRASIDNVNGQIRWVPHHRMLADGLTKLHGNNEMLLRTLSSGRYQTTAETEEMGARKEQRAAGQAIKRPRRSDANLKNH